LLAFDTIVPVVVLVAISVMYLKTRELYQLSLQKGIKYLNNAMLFYFIGFSVRLLSIYLDFFYDGIVGTYETTFMGLGLVFINIYASFIGGLYLAYCLVWRSFEKDRFTNFHPLKVFIVYLVAFLIVASDIYLMVFHRFRVPLIFYASVIGVLIAAIIMNCRHCNVQTKKQTNINPFLSLAGLGLGVYIATLVENLIDPFFFGIHYYAWGIIMVFTLAFMYHVLRIAR